MYEYPEVDEEGKKFRWASRKGGGRYRIYQKEYNLNKFSKNAKKYAEAYLKPNEKTIGKKEYGRLCHTIDSNQNKWRKGEINFQIIGNKLYIFKYNGFNDFEIVDVDDWS